MKKIQNTITRLRKSMSSPVIDCRELSRLIDELQNQKPVKTNPRKAVQGGAR